MEEININLPKTIGAWSRPASLRLITSKNIFDYMNGAGELYLGYHFRDLSVYEYKSGDENDLVVEIYSMKSSDDAFGLLSMDWGGEAVTLDQPGAGESTSAIAPPFRALYGKGLLRAWCGSLYVRIMAFREIPGVKDAILQLGRIIAASRQNTAPPEMLKVISAKMSPNWILRRDKVAYFYSHLVLNSLYYLSHQNILNLDHATEAVFASYERPPGSSPQDRCHFLVIKYPQPEKARLALDSFHNAYLPEQKRNESGDFKEKNTNFFKIEDGWLGYKLRSRYIALVFECPDRESAQAVIDQVPLH